MEKIYKKIAQKHQKLIEFENNIDQIYSASRREKTKPEKKRKIEIAIIIHQNCPPKKTTFTSMRMAKNAKKNNKTHQNRVIVVWCARILSYAYAIYSVRAIHEYSAIPNVCAYVLCCAWNCWPLWIAEEISKHNTNSIWWFCRVLVLCVCARTATKKSLS